MTYVMSDIHSEYTAYQELLGKIIFSDNDDLYVSDEISQGGNSGQVIMQNNHMAIDCGKVFGRKLAAVCPDTIRAFYA